MDKQSIKKELIRNYFWSTASTLVNRVVTLILTIIIARLLMPAGYGVYALALSTAALFTVFTDFGVNFAFSKYLSESLVKNKSRAVAYYHYLIRLKVRLAVISSFVLLLLAFPIAYYIYGKPSLFLPLVASSAYIFFSTIESFYNSLLYAIKKVKYAGFKESIFGLLSIALTLLVFLIISKQYQPFFLILGLAVSYLISSIFSLFVARRISPQIFVESNEKIAKQKLFKFLGYLTLAAVAIVFFTYVDVITIGIFLPSEYAGYYRIAMSLVLTTTGVLAFSNIMLPYFSEHGNKRTQEIFRRVFKYSSIICIPAVFGLAVMGKYLVRFLYGYEYLPAITPLYILALLVFELNSTNIIFALFTGKAKTKYVIKPLVVATILNIVLCYLLVSSLSKISFALGMFGAAASTVATRYLYFILVLRAAKKHMGVNVDIKSILKSILASLIMSVLILYLASRFSDINIINGVFLVVVGIVCYFVLSLLFKNINKEDLNIKRVLNN
jgi:PST family polysaccharide transporter